MLDFNESIIPDLNYLSSSIEKKDYGQDTRILPVLRRISQAGVPIEGIGVEKLGVAENKKSTIKKKSPSKKPEPDPKFSYAVLYLKFSKQENFSSNTEEKYEQIKRIGSLVSLLINQYYTFELCFLTEILIRKEGVIILLKFCDTFSQKFFKPVPLTFPLKDFLGESLILTESKEISLVLLSAFCAKKKTEGFKSIFLREIPFKEISALSTNFFNLANESNQIFNELEKKDWDLIDSRPPSNKEEIDSTFSKEKLAPGSSSSFFVRKTFLPNSKKPLSEFQRDLRKYLIFLSPVLLIPFVLPMFRRLGGGTPMRFSEKPVPNPVVLVFSHKSEETNLLPSCSVTDKVTPQCNTGSKGPFSQNLIAAPFPKNTKGKTSKVSPTSFLGGGNSPFAAISFNSFAKGKSLDNLPKSQVRKVIFMKNTSSRTQPLTLAKIERPRSPSFMQAKRNEKARRDSLAKNKLYLHLRTSKPHMSSTTIRHALGTNESSDLSKYLDRMEIEFSKSAFVTLKNLSETERLKAILRRPYFTVTTFLEKINFQFKLNQELALKIERSPNDSTSYPLRYLLKSNTINVLNDLYILKDTLARIDPILLKISRQADANYKSLSTAEDKANLLRIQKICYENNSLGQPKSVLDKFNKLMDDLPKILSESSGPRGKQPRPSMDGLEYSSQQFEESDRLQKSLNDEELTTFDSRGEFGENSNIPSETEKQAWPLIIPDDSNYGIVPGNWLEAAYDQNQGLKYEEEESLSITQQANAYFQTLAPPLTLGDPGQPWIEAVILDNERQSLGEPPSSALQKTLKNILAGMTIGPAEQQNQGKVALKLTTLKNESSNAFEILTWHAGLTRKIGEVTIDLQSRLTGKMLGRISMPNPEVDENLSKTKNILPKILKDSDSNNLQYDEWPKNKYNEDSKGKG